MEKISLAVLFGGQSSEHDVSCVSVTNVAASINKDKYDILLIGITKEGKWLHVPSLDAVKDGSWKNGTTEAVISPDATDKAVLLISGDKVTKRHIDIAFPVLHGLYGEDGTVQGLFTLAGIPYVGCGILASAVSMDKFFTKLIVNTIGVRQAKFVPVYKSELSELASVVARVENELPYPVFVKPSNAGSSCGVSKAHDRKELEAALVLAAEHDYKILVEETIVGRELECAIFADSASPIASGVGEVLAADDFYSYDAKYNNSESKTVVSPELPAGKLEEIRDAARRIFRAVDGFGLSRVDFFLEKDTNEVVFNEINTLPGFTAISMYPMLFDAAGLHKDELVEKLIQSAKERER